MTEATNNKANNLLIPYYIYLKLNRINISEFKKLEKGSYKRELSLPLGAKKSRSQYH